MGELAIKDSEWLIEVKNGNFAEVIQEEMEDLGAISFEVAKVPSGGGLAFEVGNDDDTEPVKALVGVILYHHRMNAYWPNVYSGEKTDPACTSYDGKFGIDRETGERVRCEECPMNQFGANGKMCKNMIRIYFLREGEFFPIQLTLPPTSIKALKNYIGSKKVVLSGLRSWQVMTEIKLQKAQSKTGITYSECVFNKLRNLTKEEAETMRGMAEAVKSRSENQRFETIGTVIEVQDEGVPFVQWGHNYGTD